MARGNPNWRKLKRIEAEDRALELDYVYAVDRPEKGCTKLSEHVEGGDKDGKE